MSEHKQRQYELRGPSGASLVCWLKNDPRLKVGVALTLKETGDLIWVVSVRYHELRSADDAEFRRGWKVGGLV